MTREEAIEVIKAFVSYGKYVKAFAYKGNTSIPIEALNMAIEALQQEPKRGKWIEIDEYSECSCCGAESFGETPFCPYYGVRMENGE